MRDHYDFSKAERGKFYRPDASIEVPIYLDEEVLAYLTERADAKGIDVAKLVNDLLRRDIELAEAIK